MPLATRRERTQTTTKQKSKGAGDEDTYERPLVCFWTQPQRPNESSEKPNSAKKQSPKDCKGLRSSSFAGLRRGSYFPLKCPYMDPSSFAKHTDLRP